MQPKLKNEPKSNRRGNTPHARATMPAASPCRKRDSPAAAPAAQTAPIPAGAAKKIRIESRLGAAAAATTQEHAAEERSAELCLLRLSLL